MWKPDQPIEIAGEALTNREAWRREFGNAFHELCADEVDGEWLRGLRGLAEVIGESVCRHRDSDAARCLPIAGVGRLLTVGNRPERRAQKRLRP